MCGICGIIGRDLEPVLGGMRPMAMTLRHRGPDELGERVVADAGGKPAGWFGHTRLKVIDPSENARQPMSSDDGSIVLTYNGEIYNFRKLRDELRGCGHRFRSSGDTEVVLRAYEQWGDDFVRRLDGMFALALWDARKGSLLLARDRMGKKPLFYACFDDGIAFGSEIKAVLACPFIRPEIDELQLSRLLVYGYAPWPATLYRGIEQVPPAATVIFDRRGLQPPQPYWSALPAGDPVRLSPANTGRVADLVEQAVVRRMVTDVPLGALLSGGIDSSVVVGIMSRHLREPVNTFSVGFPEEPSYDERSPARGVAAHFKTCHHEFSVRVDALALLDRLVWHHDQPFADSSAIPTFLISQLARDHVTVVLTGDGGDEVFGGYDRFVAARVSRTLPSGVAAMARRSVRALPRNSGYVSVRRRAERFLELADAPLERRYQSWISVFAPDALSDLLAKGGPAESEVTESITRQYAEARSLPRLDRILYANLRTYLPDDLAVKMDRMSMANSLEARSPLLDTQLIEYIGRIPAADKVGVRTLKPVLRASLGPLLPKWVWDRRKHGFGVPIGSWLRGSLGEVVEDELLADSARVRQFVDLEHVRRLYREHRVGQAEHGMRLWTLLTVERWLRSLDGPVELEPPAAPAIRDAELAG